MSGNSGVCLKCGFNMYTTKNHCYHCGVAVNQAQAICTSCGVSLNTQAAHDNQSGQSKYYAGTEPILAALVSFLITGVGQMLNRQFVKGIVMLAVSFFMWIIGVILILPLLFVFVIWVVSIVDAYLIAQKIRNGKTVGEWEMF
jgi:TM2 domain-containing membrane protein YozV